MQISSRFTVALHIFTCIDVFRNEQKVTSDFLAGSIGTNPVIIRRLLGQLKDAGLITVARGTGGCEPTRSLNEITFYDVYKAVDAVEDETLAERLAQKKRADAEKVRAKDNALRTELHG